MCLINSKAEFDKLRQINGVPYVFWCFWYKGKMNENRKRGLNLMVENFGVPVCLITSENINQFIANNQPLHPAFEYLSDVHKSDYIRIYLWHNFGGGWHDIKPTEINYSQQWDHFANENVYLVGSAENAKGAAKTHDKNGLWMPDYWQHLVGCGWWIGRQKTALSTEIMNDINNYLDENFEALKKHPAKTSYDKKRESKYWLVQMWYKFRNGYPLPWTVFGNFFHPANYKFRNHIINTMPKNQIYNLGLPYK